MTRDITITGYQETEVALKNCTPFTKCITKIDEKTIDDVEDGFILKNKQLILMQILLIPIILNLLNIRLIY